MGFKIFCITLTRIRGNPYITVPSEEEGGGLPKLWVIWDNFPRIIELTRGWMVVEKLKTSFIDLTLKNSIGVIQKLRG